MSGYASIAANPFKSEYPVLGSVVAKQLEGQTRDLPLYVGSNMFYGGGPGFFGPAYVPFMYRGNPNSSSFGIRELSGKKRDDTVCGHQAGQL